MKKKVANAVIVFIGLMLSPITWWNDPFINIPISYLAASLIASLSPRLFSVSLIIFYWLTNILGIFLLYIAGERVIKDKFNGKKQFITIIIYSLFILLLSISGLIRPFSR